MNINLYHKLKRIKIKKMGLCPQCSKRPPTSGYVSCEECRTRMRLYVRERYECIIKNPEITDNRPKQPIICPLCESIPTKFYWHHWDDYEPNLGMWLCPYCNHIVELEDRSLVERYKEFKLKITDEFYSNAKWQVITK